MNNLLIAYTTALPLITFLIGVMYGGSEARKELKGTTAKPYSFTHTNPGFNRYKRYIRAQKN
jgi:hypothetical protein